jgi:hypothetical protein
MVPQVFQRLPRRGDAPAGVREARPHGDELGVQFPMLGQDVPHDHGVGPIDRTHDEVAPRACPDEKA